MIHNYLKIKFNLRTKAGFTMVEALVAITILLIAVIGPLSLLATALRDSTYLKNEITANYLAQEGIEVVIYLNDSGESLSPGEYCVDVTKTDPNSVLFPPSTEEGCPILNAGGFYVSAQNSEGTPTIFSRTIQIESVRNEVAEDYGAQELKVISKVIWKNKGFLSKKDISYMTYVFN